MKTKRTFALIVRRKWKKYKYGGALFAYCEGWFLFGFIPLYIIEIGV